MAETLPQFLFEHAQTTPHKIAIRERNYGIWQAVTWRQYAEHVKNFSLGLVSLGLTPDETIAVIGDNRRSGSSRNWRRRRRAQNPLASIKTLSSKR